MIVMLTVWIVLAIVAGIVASNKNRSVAGWVLLSLLVAPLTLLILLALKPLPAEQVAVADHGPKTAPRTLTLPLATKPVPSDEKKCPMCAELVKRDARICRFCRYEFSASDQNVAQSDDEVAGIRQARLIEIADFLLGQFGEARRLTPDAIAEIQTLLKSSNIALSWSDGPYELTQGGSIRYAYGDRELGRALQELSACSEGSVSGRSSD